MEQIVDDLEHLTPRDISWLQFNYRVLQEAKDPGVPLYERIKFLAIYSSNLDEFFRVRVASLRSFKKLRKDTRKRLNVRPKKALQVIRTMVNDQQTEFGRIYRDEVLPALARKGIYLINDWQYDEQQAAFVRQYFDEKVRPLLAITPCKINDASLFLENRSLYFVVTQMEHPDELCFVNIPDENLPRFTVLPSQGKRHFITYLDDIVRFNLQSCFTNGLVTGAYSIKVSRDAELYIDDEYSGNLIEKIRGRLEERNLGLPTRLLYDSSMPTEVLDKMTRILGLSKYDIIPGSRYHNFNDFFGFPNPANDSSLSDEAMPPLEHPELVDRPSVIQAIAEKDRILHFPYQSVDYLLQFMEEAIQDPSVDSLHITLYRVAAKSMVGELLLKALEAGKRVHVFIEAKARFDEASNLAWGSRLEEAGAQVWYSKPGIKVHTKLLLINRNETASPRRLAYIGTGNFNEKTAKLYCDHALLTANEGLCGDILQVFKLLETGEPAEAMHALVAPTTLRSGFEALIDAEIAAAKKGEEAYMILKMNSLEDPGMIKRLYAASKAGVKIQLIVRGIFCLLPGVPDLSEHIQARSIVDRFLEHARVYIFCNGGKEKMYIASADWMTRNLDHRIEIAAPIYDLDVQAQIRKIIDFQLADNMKARSLHSDSLNDYLRDDSFPPIRAQVDTYRWLKGLVSYKHTSMLGN